MKRVLLALLCFFSFSALSFAQGSNLTIFSEDGDKFILYLNGLQQNTISQANLRLQGLVQPYYKARIVFDNAAKAPVDKNIQVVDPSTQAAADVVYKIKNKDGEMKLRFFSAQQVQQNYAPPADVHVVQYGQPDQATTVTQTTITTTNVNGGAGSANMNVTGGGMNLNVNIPDPSMGGSSVTQTTTTTTHTYSQNDNNGYATQPAQTGCQYPMDDNSFMAAKETINQSTFEDTKVSSAKAILTSNCVSTDQVVQICQLFTYEQSKLNFAKFAYSKTTDPGNYFKVGNIFTYDNSKTDLNHFISNAAR